MPRLTRQLDAMDFGERFITVVYVVGFGGLGIVILVLGLARLFS